MSGVGDSTYLLQLIEELCRYNDKLTDETRKDKEDLQQQVTNANDISKFAAQIACTMLHSIFVSFEKTKTISVGLMHFIKRQIFILSFLFTGVHSVSETHGLFLRELYLPKIRCQRLDVTTIYFFILPIDYGSRYKNCSLFFGTSGLSDAEHAYSFGVLLYCQQVPLEPTPTPCIHRVPRRKVNYRTTN